MTNKDVYEPLLPRSRTIRLLKLLPGLWNDHIGVELHQTTIAAARDRYTAISYTWGAQGTVKQFLITCNGLSVPVSENLYTILRRLRQADDSIFAWADALCINQMNPLERTHQVGLMGEIYENSRETIVWLGEKTASDDTGEINYRGQFSNCYVAPEVLTSMGKGSSNRVAWQGNKSDKGLLDAYLAVHAQSRAQDNQNDIFGAFCLIRDFARGASDYVLRELKESESRPKESETSNQKSSTPKLLRSKLLTRPGHNHDPKVSRVWAGLERLMSLPWWTRIWVIQETVLSRKATIQFGMLSAPWTMFADAASNFVRERHSLCLDLAGTLEGHHILTRFSDLVLQIDDTRKHHQSSVKDANLLSLLWKFRPLEASDKRDKVFALLGLTTDWQGIAPMSPDYGIDAAAVFTNTASRNILSSASLSVLAGDLDATLGRKREAGLPSWVMDWALPCLPIETERVKAQRMYNASGGRIGEVLLHHRHSILQVKGVHVDDVITIGDVSRHTQISDTLAVIRQWNLVAMAFADTRGSEPRYPTGCTYSEAFWRTLLGDLVQVASVANTSTDEKQYRKATADDAEAFRAWRMWARCISRDTLARMAYISQRDLDEGISSIHYALKTTTASRRFFITRNGFIGVGPKTTQPGDQLHVFENSRVPFLCRPRNARHPICMGGLVMTLIESPGSGRRGLCSRCFKPHLCHQLVGDCFAYGLMDGEAFEQPGAKVGPLYLG